MTSPQPLKVVFGAGGVRSFGPNDYSTDEGLKKLTQTLLKYGVTQIDTAQRYGKSEETLGEIRAGDKFILDTKWPGGADGKGSLNRDQIITVAEASKTKLGSSYKINIFYIHVPDEDADYEEVAAAVDEVHKQGVFDKFGLSNFSAADTQKVYDICKAHGYVLPSVYQGNYSAVARRSDTELLPTLRRLNMAFYAYSPLAGGFLTKTREQILEKKTGRFTEEAIGGMYLRLYARPSYLDALQTWAEIAREEGAGRAELAFRWIAYHSPLKNEYGDAFIIGANSLQQLEDSLAWTEKGPLSEVAVEKIESIWESIKHEAFLTNLDS